MKYLVSASSAINSKSIQENFSSKTKTQKRMTEILKSGFDMAILDKTSGAGLFQLATRFAVDLKK